MATNEYLIGREDVNDIEAILSVVNRDVDSLVHAVKDNADAIFTWDYEKGKRPALNKLYEKAKGAQWNGETDLDWSIDVDLLEVAHLQRAMNPTDPALRIGTPFEHWTEDQFDQMAIESNNWMLSQFMHGEQGALICTA